MKISINRKKDTITFFFKNAIKIVVDCINMVIKKFVNGKLWNTFYIDESYPPDQIPNYVRSISKYTHRQQ